MLNPRKYSEGGSIQDNMQTMTIDINGKTYDIKLACTEEEREEGLQGVTNLPYDEGMLFIFDEPQHVGFWMKDTLIPLDIIMIDEYGEVQAIFQGEPMNETMLEADDIQFVLELNTGSNVAVGDEIDLSDIIDDSDVETNDENEDDETTESPLMSVLDDEGSSQMDLKGGERIFSRPNTKTLVRLSKRAYKSKLDKDYKALGRRLFKYLNTQNTKDDDFVEIPK